MVEETANFAGNSKTRQLTDQITSLIYLSHSIKVFPSKWKLIRNKLEELMSILSYLPPETQYSGIIHLFQDTTNLANKCIECTYSGKLLMQSDLDIMFVKFDKYLLEFINNIDSFIPNEKNAIMVSKPGVNANKDDIKFYVNDLLCRFKVGKIDMKKQALVCFNEVILKDERYVKIAMEEVDGVFNVLINFLNNSNDVGVHEEGLKSVVTICGFDLYKSVFVEMGIVAFCVRVLESGSDLGKELCLRCLMKVTMNSDNVWSVCGNGGVSLLLKICESGCDDDDDGELVGLACGVLRNLVSVYEIARCVIEQGVIRMCIKIVITSKNESSQIGAIELFIKVMESENQFVKGLIVNEGGIRVFVSVVDPKSLYSCKVRQKSMRAVVMLCTNSSVGYMNSLITTYGFMEHILYFLQNGEVSLQEYALRTAYWLSATSDEFKKAMGDAGFIQEIVKFLDAKSFEGREIAAETLLRLLVIPRNQKRLVQNDQNVKLLLQLIEGNSGNTKVLLSIIMSLTFCNEGRKKILCSEYLKNIEKLADDQVLDAKKIIRNLSSNRLRSLIRGIWHS